jgi:ribosome-associated toxin RatA of RatAB toxin-antitoxin module
MTKLGGSATAVIDAPIEQLWDAVVDIESTPEWAEGFDQADVVERDADGRPLVVDVETDAKVRTIKMRLRLSYDEPTAVRWHQTKGDLKSLVGSWALEDLGGGRTRATYELDGDPGRMLGMLIRGPAQDRLTRLLVGERPAELAAYVGASSAPE